MVDGHNFQAVGDVQALEHCRRVSPYNSTSSKLIEELISSMSLGSYGRDSVGAVEGVKAVVGDDGACEVPVDTT